MNIIKCYNKHGTSSIQLCIRCGDYIFFTIDYAYRRKRIVKMTDMGLHLVCSFDRMNEFQLCEHSSFQTYKIVLNILNIFVCKMMDIKLKRIHTRTHACRDHSFIH